MNRGYAVFDLEQNKVIRQSSAFDEQRVTERIPLNEQFELLLCEDDAARENEALKHALLEAQEANSAKEIFLSNMSHDIRTPMNAIIGMTALAKRHIDEKGRVLDSLNKIEVASTHLLGLINEVLDMSRINSGRMAIENSVFSLSDLLHDTLTIVRPQIRQKQHDFRFTAEHIEREELNGDAMRLKQIYVNIISNAVKYTPEHGSIQVDVRERIEDDLCILSFVCADNGIGMSKEFLDRIFEPFERANSTTVSRIEGTGLGMSIVKKLIEAMSGTIHIESEPDCGTVVTIEIPLHYQTLSLDTSSLRGKRLLIIENDEKNRERFDAYLNEFSVSHTVVQQFTDAISKLTEAEFNSEPFDAVIIGKTTEETGSIFDAASYLHKSMPALPIVLVSEDNWSEIEYRANRSGIRRFVPVPMFRKSLLNALNETLKSSMEADSSAAAIPDLTGKRILLVEDNLINREIACEILGVTHAGIDTAEDGKQAVARFLASEPNGYSLILMDIQMPVMDGYEATRSIRAAAREDAKRVPIFAMTANIFAEDIAKTKEAGMNGHLAKPIDVNKLMHLLRHLA